MILVSDSSTMFTPEQAKHKDIHVFPLQVIVNEESYRDLDTITSTKLLQEIEEGASVRTSQPSIGEKIELYESHPDEVFLDITMAQGLSGTYDSALMAKASAPHPENVHVINSKTLCGPHQYLVTLAKDRMDQGQSLETIITELEERMATDHSYLVPFDFQFLLRGGRVSTVSAGLGSLLKLIPVMMKAEDGTTLEKLAVARTWKKAVKQILEDMTSKGVNEDYRFYISHANNIEKAAIAKDMILQLFPDAIVVIEPLTPAFIVQGGPGCISIQAIHK